MRNPTPDPTSLTHLQEYISQVLPWAHGHQIKGIAAIVLAIILKETGNQAELARTQGNQEAATKRFSRLIHNPRLAPKLLAQWICIHHLANLPRTGKVRFAIDWTIEDEQHLIVFSLIIGRRALPILWRAYDQKVLKGRMKRYEHAIIKRLSSPVGAPGEKVGRIAAVDASLIKLSLAAFDWATYRTKTGAAKSPAFMNG